MWIIRLLLAWLLPYWFFRLLLTAESRSAPKEKDDQATTDQDGNGYLKDVPDALRPDIEPEDFDPTDYL